MLYVYLDYDILFIIYSKVWNFSKTKWNFHIFENIMKYEAFYKVIVMYEILMFGMRGAV